jgi:hypothetical protein
MVSGPEINWMLIILMAGAAIGSMVLLALIMGIVLYFSKKSGGSEK